MKKNWKCSKIVKVRIFFFRNFANLVLVWFGQKSFIMIDSDDIKLDILSDFGFLPYILISDREFIHFINFNEVKIILCNVLAIYIIKTFVFSSDPNIRLVKHIMHYFFPCFWQNRYLKNSRFSAKDENFRSFVNFSKLLC